MNSRVLATVVTAAMTASCASQPTEPVVEGRPMFAISDARHNGGSVHFFFLPPLVPAPTATGTFDGTFSPVVEVCEWTDSCGAVVARFTRQSSTGGSTIRVDLAAEQYLANWDSKECVSGACTLDPTKTYRLRVLVAGTELGFADVDVVANGSQLKNVQTGEYIGLVDGRTLPVKFRIEQGAVAVIGADGGAAALADGTVTLSFPPGAISADIGITATSAPVDVPGSDTSVLPGTLYEFQPSPTTFAAPVTLTIGFPENLPPRIHAERLVLCKMVADACIPVPGSTANVANHTVTGEITGFSEYGVTEFPELLHTRAAYGFSTSIVGGGPYVNWTLGTSTGYVELSTGPTSSISWSPDGARLAYATSCSLNCSGFVPELRVMNADGTGQVTLRSSEAQGYAMVSWSPVGNRILYRLRSPNASDGSANGPYNGLVTLNADGTDVRTYPSILAGYEFVLMPTWSPDGQWIAFGDNACLCVINLDGTGLREIVAGPVNGGNFDVRWSPDGTHLAFVGGGVGTAGKGLWVVGVDGAGLTLAAPGEPSWMILAGWASAGGEDVLVFDRDDPGQEYRGMYTVHPDGSGERELIRGQVQTDMLAAISPDRRRIAFTWIRLTGGAGLYLINADGSGLQSYGGLSEDFITLWRP